MPVRSSTQADAARENAASSTSGAPRSSAMRSRNRVAVRAAAGTACGCGTNVCVDVDSVAVSSRTSV
jgi:hypothetical protein